MSPPYGKPLADLAIAERDAQVVALKRQDLSFQQIADTLGISKAAAVRGFQRAKRRVEQAADTDYAAYRDDQLARIATMREVVEEIVTARHVVVQNGHIVSEIIGADDDGRPVYGDPLRDDAPVLAAVDRLVRLDEREARLLGIDAAEKVSVSGGLRYEIVGIDQGDLT